MPSPSLLRTILAIVAGAAAWSVVLNGSMFALESAWADYAAARPERQYTLPMLFTRLVLFAVATAAASIVATAIGPGRWMPWLAGALLFAASLPDHAFPGPVWDAYPVWYHLTYLAYLVPVAWVAGRPILARRDLETA